MDATINNGQRAFELPAGASLTLRQGSPGATATAAQVWSDGATGFTSAALTSSTPVVIGPFGADARINVMAVGIVSVDTAGAGSAAAPTPLPINSSTAQLTHATHFNRPVILTAAGATTHTLNDDISSGAVGGDSLELDNLGPGTATLLGGTGILLVPNGFTADILPNRSGSFIYVGSNTWLAQTPAAGVQVYGITGAIASITTGGGAGQVSARMSLPANVIPIKGWAMLYSTWSRAGTTDTLTGVIKVGAAASSYAAATAIGQSSLTATAVRADNECWIKGNRVDRTTILTELSEINSGIGGVGRYTAANSLTIARDTGAAIDIIFGGDAGATDAYQLLDAVLVIYTP